MKDGLYKLVDQNLEKGENPSDGFIRIKNVTLDSGGAVAVPTTAKPGSVVSAFLFKQFTVSAGGTVTIDKDTMAPSNSADCTYIEILGPEDIDQYAPTTPNPSILTTQP